MNKEQEQRLIELMDLYLTQNLSEDALREMLSLIKSPEGELIWREKFFEDTSKLSMDSEPADVNWEKVWGVITSNKEEGIQNIQNRRRYKPLYRLLNIAAVLLIFIVSAALIYFYTVKKTSLTRVAVAKNVYPVGSGVILHLDNGKNIKIDSVSNGVIAVQGGVKIIKENGELKYIGSSSEVIYNSISTDERELWHFILPDGTKVWLNSESSIRYPIAFGRNNRTVEVGGEAYFEVKHDDAKPFFVKVGKQIIQDIGTEFNVNAYHVDDSIVTTLISGKVNVKQENDSILLVPGQQAIVNSEIKVRKVKNVESIIAWKTGMFMFYEASVSDVLQQLSEWYDVDIEYRAEMPHREFTGTIPRAVPLSDILKILQEADIHLEFDQYTVTNNKTKGKIVVLQ